MPRVSKRVAKQLEAEAEEVLVREKQIKQLLVRAGEMEDFWWERLDCKACREELLGITPLKPITSRHALGLDVYEAKAICSRLKVSSIGELFNGYQDATRKPDGQHDFWQKVQASCASKTKSAKLMELFGRLLWIKDIGRWSPPSANAQSKAKASFLSFRHSLRIREREARFGEKTQAAKRIQQKMEAEAEAAKAAAKTAAKAAAKAAGAAPAAASQKIRMTQTAGAAITNADVKVAPSSAARTPSLPAMSDVSDDDFVGSDEDDRGHSPSKGFGSLDALLSSIHRPPSSGPGGGSGGNPLLLKVRQQDNKGKGKPRRRSGAGLPRRGGWDDSTSIVRQKQEVSKYENFEKALFREAQLLRSGNRKKKKTNTAKSRLRQLNPSASTPGLSDATAKRTAASTAVPRSSSSASLITRTGSQSGKQQPKQTLAARRKEFIDTIQKQIPRSAAGRASLEASAKMDPIQRMLKESYDPNPSYLNLPALNVPLSHTFDGALDDFDEDDVGKDEDLERIVKPSEFLDIASFQHIRQEMEEKGKSTVRSRRVYGYEDKTLADTVIDVARATLRKKNTQRPSTSGLGNYVSQGTRYAVLRNVMESAAPSSSSAADRSSAADADAQVQRAAREYIKYCQLKKVPLPQGLVRMLSRRDIARIGGGRKNFAVLKKVKRSVLDEHTGIPFHTFNNIKAKDTIDLSSIAIAADQFAGGIAAALGAINEMQQQQQQGIGSGTTMAERPLKGLIMRQNGLSAVGAAALVSSFAESNPLDVGTDISNLQWATLDLSSNQIGRALIPATFSNLRHKPLKKLSKKRLAQQPAAPKSPVELFCIGLRGQHRLRYLNLAQNKIRCQGAIQLASALTALPSLERLEMGNNELGDKGAIAMAGLLARTTQLRYLGVSWQKVGPAGVEQRNRRA